MPSSSFSNRCRASCYRDPREVVERATALTSELGTLIEPGIETLVALARRGLAEESEWTYVCKDGSRFAAVVLTTALRDAAGHFTGVVESVRDITDKRRAEQALRESEERYRALYANIPSMYFTIDPTGTVLSVNAFGASQLGYTEGELVGGSVLRIIPRDQQAEAIAHLAECVAHPSDVFSWESRRVRKDGSLLDVKETARAVPDQQGGLIVLVVCEDITERHLLQQQLFMAQKMEAVGRLAGGVAHDFNNLLTAIRGFAELHLAEHSPGDPGREDVLEIERAAERAAQLTQRLLAFSRRADVHPVALDLAEVAGDAVALLRRLVGEDIDVLLDSSTDVLCVLADRLQIDQVLLNLAANARDAMPAGGALHLAVKPAILTKTFVRAHPGSQIGRHVLLEVSDTGVGMDEATQAHLFEPFFTTKPPGEGTGLGLASVYGIVKQAGGYIDVESRPGGGSVFRVYLPALDGATPEAPAKAATANTRTDATETILLVEDEPAVRIFAQRVLEDHGYRVLAFGDPGVALDAGISDPGAFDALVTDVVMPTMSGPTLAERIAAIRPDLPVLFMSGHGGNVLPAGAPPPLAKPFSAGDLADAVGALFARSCKPPP